MTARVWGDFHALAEALQPGWEGEILERVSMRSYTSFRIGGLCELMVFPKNVQELLTVIGRCQEQKLPWRVMGAGTNLLVLDGGVEEVLVNLSKSFRQMRLSQDGQATAEAGLRLARLVKTCQVWGFSGLEFAAGIPGTVGGALVMNAGAMGADMAGVVEQAKGLLPEAGPFRWSQKQLKFSYRHLKRPDHAIFTEVSFVLQRRDPKKIRAKILQGLQERRQRQPLQFPSAGSVFKNPPGHYAGQLIEAAGLKGLRLGDAQVSGKHANFIVNRGRARSREVLALIEKIQQRVREHSGIKLELEIEVIGKE